MKFQKVIDRLLNELRHPTGPGQIPIHYPYRRRHWPDGEWITINSSPEIDTYLDCICWYSDSNGSTNCDEYFPTEEDIAATDWEEGRDAHDNAGDDE